MSREMSFNSDDPDFDRKFAWSLHEVLGCPLRASAHDPVTGWCTRQEQLTGIARRLREHSSETKNRKPGYLVPGQLCAWSE